MEDLEKRRVEWLNEICEEARELGFSCLSELAEWMLENADKIRVKSGED